MMKQQQTIYKKSIRRLLLLLLTTVLSATAGAQTLKFGYFSYDEVLKAMPDYVSACRQQDSLKAQFDAEAQRMADEFNNKYEEFLEVQRTLAPTILNKRQSELQELVERGEKFKQQANIELSKSKEEALAPVRQRLMDAVREQGERRSLAFILNTDREGLPFVNPEMGEDLTQILIDQLSQ